MALACKGSLNARLATGAALSFFPARPLGPQDTYFPSRLCRASRTLCNATAAGVQSWPSSAACCAKGAAFGEGCSAAPPPTPCFLVGSYWPQRTCVRSSDEAVCNRGGRWLGCEELASAPCNNCGRVVRAVQRLHASSPLPACTQLQLTLSQVVSTQLAGWGVYQSDAVCCAPGVAFAEGCSSAASTGAAIAGVVAPAKPTEK